MLAKALPQPVGCAPGWSKVSEPSPSARHFCALLVHNLEHMPYRPPKRSTPTGSRNGNGKHHRPSYAARLAIARPRSRKPAEKGAGAIVAVALVLVVSVLGVVSVGAIAGGGAAAVTIATLEQGLPDVREFQDLDFSEPTRIMDRHGKVELARFWDERREVIDFEDIPPLVLDVTTATEDDTFWDNPGFDLEATVNAFLTAAAGAATAVVARRSPSSSSVRDCCQRTSSPGTTPPRASTCARPRSSCSPSS